MIETLPYDRWPAYCRRLTDSHEDDLGDELVSVAPFRSRHVLQQVEHEVFQVALCHHAYQKSSQIPGSENQNTFKTTEKALPPPPPL